MSGQPWHAEARRLRDAGEKYEYIAFVVERSATTVWRFLNGKQSRTSEARKREYHRKRLDPEWRAKYAAQTRKSAAKRKAQCPATQSANQSPPPSTTPSDA